MFQRGLSQDPATHERYRASKAPGPGPSSKRRAGEHLPAAAHPDRRAVMNDMGGLASKGCPIPRPWRETGGSGAFISNGRNRGWRTGRIAIFGFDRHGGGAMLCPSLVSMAFFNGLFNGEKRCL